MFPNAETKAPVEVSWANTEGGSFNATISIIAYDHVSLLGQLALSIGNMNVPIMAVSAKKDEKRKTSQITMVVQVTTREQLDKVIKALGKIGFQPVRQKGSHLFN